MCCVNLVNLLKAKKTIFVPKYFKPKKLGFSLNRFVFVQRNFHYSNKLLVIKTWQLLVIWQCRGCISFFINRHVRSYQESFGGKKTYLISLTIIHNTISRVCSGLLWRWCNNKSSTRYYFTTSLDERAKIVWHILCICKDVMLPNISYLI